MSTRRTYPKGFEKWFDYFFISGYSNGINHRWAAQTLYCLYLGHSNQWPIDVARTSFKQALKDYAAEKRLFFNPQLLNPETKQPLFRNSDTGRPEMDDRRDRREYFTIGDHRFWELWQKQLEREKQSAESQNSEEGGERDE